MELCTDVLCTLGHLKWYWTPLLKQLNPTLSGLLKIIYKASVITGTQAQTSSQAIQNSDDWNFPCLKNEHIHVVGLVGFIFCFPHF